MKSQMPNTVYKACILEECSAVHTFGIFLSEQAARDRIQAERRKFNPNFKGECWLWIETVKNGEVISKKHLPVVTESQRNEVYASC